MYVANWFLWMPILNFKNGYITFIHTQITFTCLMFMKYKQISAAYSNFLKGLWKVLAE